MAHLVEIEAAQVSDSESEPDAAVEEEEALADAADGKEDYAELAVDPVGEAKFLFNARRAFLTYAQADGLTKERIGDIAVRNWHAKRYVIGEEQHEDGGRHFHVLVFWPLRLKTRQARYWDIDGYHPKVLTMRTDRDVDKVFHYCVKDGDYVEKNYRMFTTSTNFMRRKADFDAWLHYQRVTTERPNVYPVRFPSNLITYPQDGIEEIAAPDARVKRRHHIFFSPPEYRKTFWSQLMFPKAYRITDLKSGFDKYEGEQVIIFDDILPDDKTLKDSCVQPIVHNQPCPGWQRYNMRFFKKNVPTLVLVLLNAENFSAVQNYIASAAEAVLARFYVHWMEHPFEEDE